MPDDNAFADFLSRIRAGDASAAEELVRLYEPAIRVAVRTNLVDPNLRRHFDSMDVCQSVLGSFFIRAAAGQYDLGGPEQLVALLVRIAQNKLAMRARGHHQMKRDARRAEGGEALEAEKATGPSPSQAAAGRDLLSSVLKRLGDEEREIAQRRAIGQDWNSIAADMGGTADGRRKQLGRALELVAANLGLDEDGDE